MAQKVILDVDPGLDDAVAILLAGRHPALELKAVTVTYGNAQLSVTLDNTLRVMQAGGLTHVPVYAGAASALVAGPPAADPLQQASLPLPEPRLNARPGRAAQFLADYYLGPDGPDTVLVPLGPHTNLALALRLAPEMADRIPRIVTMAGAYQEGNVTSSAEFNVHADPEAAHIVFRSGIPITMLGLEVTAQALVSSADVERLRGRGTPLAKVSALLVEHQIQWFIRQLGWDGGQVYDACAVAAVIEPGILETRRMHVDIELQGELTRGRTVADLSGLHPLPPDVDVGVKLNRRRFWEILFEGLG